MDGGSVRVQRLELLVVFGAKPVWPRNLDLQLCKYFHAPYDQSHVALDKKLLHTVLVKSLGILRFLNVLMKAKTLIL